MGSPGKDGNAGKRGRTGRQGARGEQGGAGPRVRAETTETRQKIYIYISKISRKILFLYRSIIMFLEKIRILNVLEELSLLDYL